MRKAIYMAGILILGMIFLGCSGGSRIRNMNDSIVFLQQENRTMVSKVENLELKVSDAESRLKSTELELASLKVERSRLKVEAEQAAKSVKIEESAKAESNIKIKVVARGSKGVKSATAGMMKIRKLGYKVGAVDKAGGKDIKKKTIFYRSGQKAVAHKISKALGGGLVLKEINWKSALDIIVAP